jgi:nucleoside-diphosphate-sugar epimerase
MERKVLGAVASVYVGGQLIPRLLERGNEVVGRDDSAGRVWPIPLTPFDQAVRSALVRSP